MLLYVLAMFRPVGPLFEYIINENYIAEFLCINKANKELHCNGKCYLMQRLSEQNEEKKQHLPRIALEEYPIGFVELLQMNLWDTTIPQRNAVGYIESYSYLYSRSNFHPPTLVG